MIDTPKVVNVNVFVFAHACDDVTRTYMRCLDRLGANVVIQADANDGPWTGPDGSDALDPTPYRSVRFGLCLCLLGDAGYFGAPDYNAGSHRLWFDEYAIDSGGNCIAYTAGRSTINGALGYAGARIGGRTVLPN